MDRKKQNNKNNNNTNNNKMSDLQHILKVMEFNDKTTMKIIKMTGGTFQTFLRTNYEFLQRQLEAEDLKFAFGSITSFKDWYADIKKKNRSADIAEEFTEEVWDEWFIENQAKTLRVKAEEEDPPSSTQESAKNLEGLNIS